MAQRRRLDAEAATGLGDMLARLLAPEGLNRSVYSADGPAAVATAIALARRHWRLAGRPDRHRILTPGQIGDGGAETAAALLFRPSDAIDADRLRAIRARHGTLLIADETVTGLGRTGTMVACRHWALRPDLMALAAPLGITAIGGRAAGAAQGDGRRGRLPACAQALEAIEAIVDGNLTGNAARQGALLLGVLARLAETAPLIGRVHGRGLLIGIDLVADKAGGAPLAANDPRCNAIITACADHGLPVHLAASTLVLVPPLTLTADETAAIAQALRVILR